MIAKTISHFNSTVIQLNADNISYFNGFCCGVDSLDYYIKNNAINDLTNGNGVTYLVIDTDLNTLVGYYTLSASAIPYEGKKSLSAISIDMFAIHNEYKDTLLHSENKPDIVLSDYILGGLIGDCYRISAEVLGARFIVLHAITDAVSFYSRNYFAEVTEDVLPNDDFTEGCKPMAMDLFPEMN